MIDERRIPFGIQRLAACAPEETARAVQIEFVPGGAAVTHKTISRSLSAKSQERQPAADSPDCSHLARVR
jgi:hypothetical protein